MANLSIDGRKSLQFSVHRIVSAELRDILSMMEELACEHDECMQKLEAALPEQYHTYLALADYFTPDRADRLRRAILGRGNDCSRAVQDEISKYGISLTTPAPSAPVSDPSTQSS